VPVRAAQDSLTLGLTAGVTWNKDGTPTLPDRDSLLEPAVGLGDLLIVSGQPRMGRRLLESVLERQRAAEPAPAQAQP